MRAASATAAAETGTTALEPLSGLDSAFLALESESNRLHVAAAVVLDPPEGTRSLYSSTTRYAQIRAVVAARLHLVPRLRQRALRLPLDLQRPVWVDDPHLDLDWHVRRATIEPPGDRAQLDRLIGDFLSRPLDMGRPLWEMLVVEELAGGRSAVVGRLHHAILDGVSGATAMGVFLDLAARPRPLPEATVPPPDRLPTPAEMAAHVAAELARQPEAVATAVWRGLDTAAAIRSRNRRAGDKGPPPPPALFSAPRTPLNGAITGERRYTSLVLSLEDLELVRRAGSAGGAPAPTVNDVILAAVGGALRRHLEAQGRLPDTSLVALVPVSTLGRPSVPAPGSGVDVGNRISGMLVALGTTVEDPLDRLGTVAVASAAAKEQEEVAGGDLLEALTRAIPPVAVAGLMRAAGAGRVFDRVRPPFNVVVSTLVVPDVPLWWAGCPVAAVYPAGPVVDGVGLNVTAMTYRGAVHIGLLGSPRLVPDMDALSGLLDDAVAELVLAALHPPRASVTGPGVSDR